MANCTFNEKNSKEGVKISSNKYEFQLDFMCGIYWSRQALFVKKGISIMQLQGNAFA